MDVREGIAGAAIFGMIVVTLLPVVQVDSPWPFYT
jgi:hypothetical protein